MRFKVMLIIGCLLLGLSAFLAITQHLWLRRANIAQGTVVELIPSRGSKGTTYTPRVQYTTMDGRAHTFTRGYSSSPPEFRVGQTVAVAYYPGNEKARILTFGQRYGFALLIGIVGASLTFGVLAYNLGNKLVPAIYQGQNIPPIRATAKNQA